MFCENEKSIHPTTHTFASHNNDLRKSQSNHNINISNKDQNNNTTNTFSNTSKREQLHSMNSRQSGDGRPFHAIPGDHTKPSIPLSKSTSLTFGQYMTPKNYLLQQNPLDRFNEPMRSSNNEIQAIQSKCNQSPTQYNPMMGCGVTTSQKPIDYPTLIRGDNNKQSAKGAVLATASIQNDSESSSGSDIIDLTLTPMKNSVPVSEMYNDDIDYMNSYLKSLPDYNELNKKINNEQQKCEDIYDRLQSINSSLKSNLLAKSNSYHSICTATTKPYMNINNSSSSSGTNNTNMQTMQSISGRSDNVSKNKIARSSSSSIVNQNLIDNPDRFGIGPMQSINERDANCPIDSTMTKQIAKVPQMISMTKPSVNNLNDMRAFVNVSVPKSASSACLTRSNSKKGLNDFWSENLAKSNQQKFGWNYNKIMANRGLDAPGGMGQPQQLANSGPNYQPKDISSATNGYKLQKNMSLSQLDQRIRQNVSREELYNLICNNEQSKVQVKHPTVNSIGQSTNYNNSISKIQQQQQHQKQSQKSHRTVANLSDHKHFATIKDGNQLSKSISQTSVPSSMFNPFMKVKSPRKASIPTLFKPLCKSTSNTHVFNRNYDVSDEPHETFTPKLLVKSSSSSSIFKTPSDNYYNTINNWTLNNAKNRNDNITSDSNVINNKRPNNGQMGNYMQTTVGQPIQNTNNHQHQQHNRIIKNSEMMKVQNKKLFHDPTSATMAMQSPSSNQPTNLDGLTIQQNLPNLQHLPQFCKPTMNYPTFKSKSSVQLPIHGNLSMTSSSGNSIVGASGVSGYRNTNNNRRYVVITYICLAHGFCMHFFCINENIHSVHAKRASQSIILLFKSPN